MNSIPRTTFLLASFALAFSMVCGSSLSAQSRLSDKDVEQRLKNMDDDSKKFHSSFNTSVSKSALRKTSQEADSKKLVDNFQKQNLDLYEHFKKTKKVDAYLQNSLNSAAQIEKIMNSTNFDAALSSQWDKIKSELSDIAKAFNVPGF
jgi:hypothetical protein